MFDKENVCRGQRLEGEAFPEDALAKAKVAGSEGAGRQEKGTPSSGTEMPVPPITPGPQI